jgi:guanylate kinase
MTTGSDWTRLIVLRGNSGAGKSTVAAELRAACGQGLAWNRRITSAGPF